MRVSALKPATVEGGGTATWMSSVGRGPRPVLAQQQWCRVGPLIVVPEGPPEGWVRHGCDGFRLGRYRAWRPARSRRPTVWIPDGLAIRDRWHRLTGVAGDIASPTRRQVDVRDAVRASVAVIDAGLSGDRHITPGRAPRCGVGKSTSPGSPSFGRAGVDRGLSVTVTLPENPHSWSEVDSARLIRSRRGPPRGPGPDRLGRSPRLAIIVRPCHQDTGLTLMSFAVKTSALLVEDPIGLPVNRRRALNGQAHPSLGSTATPTRALAPLMKVLDRGRTPSRVRPPKFGAVLQPLALVQLKDRGRGPSTRTPAGPGWRRLMEILDRGDPRPSSGRPSCRAAEVGSSSR